MIRHRNKKKQWRQFEDHCPECDTLAEVHTHFNMDNWATEGDDAKCPNCGLKGKVQVIDEDVACVDWVED